MNLELPPLPDPADGSWMFTLTQMRIYAVAAILAERVRCAEIVDNMIRATDNADALRAIREGDKP